MSLCDLDIRFYSRGFLATAAALLSSSDFQGNPIATVACFKFIVHPFLSHLSGEDPPTPTFARVVNGTSRDLSM